MFHIADTEANIFQRLPKDIFKIILNLLAKQPDQNWESLMAFFLVNKYHYSYFKDEATLKKITLDIQCEKMRTCSLADVHRVLMANYLEKSTKYPDMHALLDHYGCKSSNPDILSVENENLLLAQKSSIANAMQQKKENEYSPVPTVSAVSTVGLLTLSYLYYCCTSENASSLIDIGVYVGIAALTYVINQQARSAHNAHLEQLTQPDKEEIYKIDRTIRNIKCKFFKNHEYNKIDIYLPHVKSDADFRKLITANQSMPLKRLAKEADGSGTLGGILFGLSAIALGLGAAYITSDNKSHHKK